MDIQQGLTPVFHDLEVRREEAISSESMKVSEYIYFYMLWAGTCHTEHDQHIQEVIQSLWIFDYS
jgi:hypothetical protein